MKKKPNIKELLTSNNLNDSIIELDNYISTLCEWGDNLPVLTYPQMVFYFNQELEREVNNGGFKLYFHNSSGRYANDTVDTLRLIEANVTADILASAIDLFPGSRVPIDYDERQIVFNQINEDAHDHWNKLDEQFFKYEDDLNKLNFEFVMKNEKYF